MTATLWIHEKTCRTLVRDADGGVIDMGDDWNNRASAEASVYTSYPEAKIQFVQQPDKIRELNREWDSCKFGQG